MLTGIARRADTPSIPVVAPLSAGDPLSATLDGLASLPVTTKPMFGGQGLYLDGHFFGLSYDGRLYFRTDAASRGDYISYGMNPLQPSHNRRGPTAGRHYEVPSAILAHAGLLRDWATRAAATDR